MMWRIRSFFLSRKGLNTVEVVVILAVVLGIALIFRKEIFAFVQGIIDSIFDSDTYWLMPTESVLPT
jgi:hypothetical protein